MSHEEILKGFAGFQAGRTHLTPIPTEFFAEILPLVDDLAELKAILYTFWRLSQGTGDVRYVRLDDVLADLTFLAGMGKTTEEQEANTRAAFTRAAQRGVLIEVEIKKNDQTQKWYFLNSAKGRAAVQRLGRGDFRGVMHPIDDVVVGLEKERPNTFILYEQNIGVITPMIADKLRQLERDYPAEWIYDAFSLALERNARNLSYIKKILENWAQNGKDTPSQPGRHLGTSHIEDRKEPDEPGLFIHE